MPSPRSKSHWTKATIEKQDLLNYLWLVFAQQKVNANWGNVGNPKVTRAVGSVSHYAWMASRSFPKEQPYVSSAERIPE